MANDALWSIHSGRREGSGGPAIPQSFPPRFRPWFGVCLGRARKPPGASGPLFPASPSLLLHKVVHGPSGRPGWRRDRDFSREIESLRAWSASRGSRAQLIRSELVHGKADRAWALVRSHGASDDFVSVWGCWPFAIRHLSTGNAPDIRGRVGRRFQRSVRAPAHSLLHSVVHADSPHPSAACGVWRPRDVRVREGVGNSCVARCARRRWPAVAWEAAAVRGGWARQPEGHTNSTLNPTGSVEAAKAGAGAGQWLPTRLFT